MIETYRMLGEERAADLQRDADRLHRAVGLPPHRRRSRLGRLLGRLPRATANDGNATADATRPAAAHAAPDH